MPVRFAEEVEVKEMSIGKETHEREKGAPQEGHRRALLNACHVNKCGKFSEDNIALLKRLYYGNFKTHAGGNIIMEISVLERIDGEGANSYGKRMNVYLSRKLRYYELKQAGNKREAVLYNNKTVKKMHNLAQQVREHVEERRRSEFTERTPEVGSKRVTGWEFFLCSEILEKREENVKKAIDEYVSKK